MAAVAVKYPAFQELGAEVLAVSVDSITTHKEWHEKELSRMVEGGALYPMISDPDGKIGHLFGVYDDDSGLDLRRHFLIDPQGVIQAVEVLAAPVAQRRRDPAAIESPSAPPGHWGFHALWLGTRKTSSA